MPNNNELLYTFKRENVYLRTRFWSANAIINWKHMHWIYDTTYSKRQFSHSVYLWCFSWSKCTTVHSGQRWHVAICTLFFFLFIFFFLIHKQTYRRVAAMTLSLKNTYKQNKRAKFGAERMRSDIRLTCMGNITDF